MMAPTSRSSSATLRSNGNLNGEPGVFDPPPSTMAAQLINGISTARQPAQPAEQSYLQSIMTEVSRMENSALKPDDPAVLLAHKHKLIYVLARALLEKLGGEDPFLNVPQAVSQASEALDVFTTTIKEFPEVLEYVLPPGTTLQARGSAPLWVWLFPRVLTLLGQVNCEKLTERVHKLFSVAFRAVSRSPKLWDMSSMFFSYLQECITTILEHLQDQNIRSETQSTGAILPSSQTDWALLWAGESETYSNSIHQCTYSIRGVSRCLLHGKSILSLLVEISTEAVSLHKATPAFQDYLGWMIDSIVSLDALEKKWLLISSIQHRHHEPVGWGFCTIKTLLSTLEEFMLPSILRKGYISLAALCVDLIGNLEGLSDPLVHFAVNSGILNLASMCKQGDSVRRMVSAHLLPLLQEISNNDITRTALGKDFVRASSVLSHACGGSSFDINISSKEDSFDSQDLLAEFQRLELLREDSTMSQVVMFKDFGRPSKRRKVVEKEDVLDEILSDVCQSLGLQGSSGLEGLNEITEESFATLGDSDRCRVMECLGYIPCAISGYLVVDRAAGKLKQRKCFLCEAIPLSDVSVRGEERVADIKRVALNALSQIIKSVDLHENRRPRVLAMFTLRRFALHFDDPEFLNLEVSSFAQWCLKSLGSSNRELRIAAGRTLPKFLRTSPVATINRFNVIGLLRSVPENENPHLQETYILAWGQVGRILNDEELNLVLLRLVEYLGNSNSVISGAAFNEILRLAEVAGVNVERFLSPFWESIAFAAVKDLLVRPQSTQMLSDLLGMSVAEFLVLTQSYTVPLLILSKQVDVIKRISEARKDKQDFLVILENSNLVPTLVLLLQQSTPDMERFIMSNLERVTSKFQEQHMDLSTLMKQAEPSSQARLLLQAAGEADDSKKSRIRLALQFLAERTGVPGATGTGSKIIGPFLEHHILGIVARLTDVVNDPRDEWSVAEKRRAVKTVDELVKVAKTYARIARPQICSCLQLAFTQKSLQECAFSAWNTVLTTLEDEDVEAMMESTFSTIIQHWNTFDKTVQNQAILTLQFLLDSRKNIVRNVIVNLPSLAKISPLADVEKQLKKLRSATDVGETFEIFAHRLGHENSGVVAQALIELKGFLRANQSFLQASAVSEQPDNVVSQLVRSILDNCIKFSESDELITQLCAECIGLVGCLDSNRVESVREYREMVVVSNFEDILETTDFVLCILEKVIVPVFLSTTDTGIQGFFSFVIQELLFKFNFREACMNQSGYEEINKKWQALPPALQDTLTPFLNSKFMLQEMSMPNTQYPLFRPEQAGSRGIYINWVKSFVLDLLRKHSNLATQLMFPILCRTIRIRTISPANFLLPYVVLHAIVAGTDQHREEIGSEILGVLQYEVPADSLIRREDLKLCVEAAFHILEYLARWIQEKQSRASKSRDQKPAEDDVERVNSVLQMIPPEIVSRRAVECRSYARALFYWEQHIRNVRQSNQKKTTNTALLQRLQDIYTQIDEPDGIEGFSAKLHSLDIDQQVLGHRKAGRWTAAQSWYEIQLAEKPGDVDIQLNLLSCLKESGQHDVLLNYVEGMQTQSKTIAKLLPFAAEASWATGRWAALEKYTNLVPQGGATDFNIGIGRSLLALQRKNMDQFKSSIHSIREQIAHSLSSATTSSLSACHENMLRLHVLTELEMIAGTDDGPALEHITILESLNRRLEVIGSYLNDKQYLLGVRRAAMQLSSLDFTKGDVASAWLTSARLARKGNAIHQSFNAVLHASQLGDDSATIEHARLLWQEGNHRKAIQALRGAIETNAFVAHNRSVRADTSHTGVDQSAQQNLLKARAHLLLAKWLDKAGQTPSSALRKQYQEAARTLLSWEKGHYYLGRHYNKLLESEKTLAAELQNEAYLTGETAKLVIENYLRSLSQGTKYIYQTLPRILTLWLDLGTQVNQPLDPRYGNSKDFVVRITGLRKAHLDAIHSRLSKYVGKMPAYMFYTALPQIVSRINHPNQEVFKWLQNMIYKVVVAHPQQALWSLLAVCTSTQQERRSRGGSILNLLVKNNKRSGSELSSHDIKAMIKNGEKLTEQLLLACNAGEFHGNRTIWASLTKDLGFVQKHCLPSLLAVPVESVLTATLPTLTDNVREHKAFSRDVVTITSFLDEVLVLSSLQKPRKLTARGSDGRKYGLMCKPKDDLRKDQRLMEFNSMINRSLKRDAESSRRQLYIKTYAVTPLNEECGIIEWVDGLKTLRDILLALYKAIGVSPNYNEIAMYCDKAIEKPDETMPFFTEKVLGHFPPVFYKWFVQQFPEPSTWFAARLRYTRSCAVMSMVGTILGLGDRHGENILFEEGNGGTFHVDFNCLFDKGLSFTKPERVPFRLTHNMIDAMGMYGYEGPFRKSSELTLKLLRQHEETLMTILEAFVYDPTLDLLAKKPDKKRKDGGSIPQTAQGVLDTIQRKVKGLLTGESVPLSVEGQVDTLIDQATNPEFLAGMYIGWCSFL